MRAVLRGVWKFSVQSRGFMFKSPLKRLIWLFWPRKGVQKVFLMLFE